MSEASESAGPEMTEAEATQAFVMWVEIMVHDLESVPDENQYWCTEWWQHPEGVSRLSAMYEAYSEAESERTLSSWWVNHWDAHARVLLSKDGPFRQCQRGHKFFERTDEYKPRLLTVSPPPDWRP